LATLGDCADRCAIEAGDFFEHVPSGGDLYVLCQILHDWDDSSCLTILRNCRAAMEREARLLVIERVLDLTRKHRSDQLLVRHGFDGAV
jgi:hypothetical protein